MQVCQRIGFSIALVALISACQSAPKEPTLDEVRAAAEKYEVTVVAKPYAKELQAKFWPGVTVLPFVAPWTAFQELKRTPPA